MKTVIYPINIETQPTEVTCGATCLHGIYHYLGLVHTLNQIIEQVPQLADGGTLGANLGLDGLNKGLDVSICSHNLKVFDPTWFHLESHEMASKLDAQIQSPGKSQKTKKASEAYRQFLLNGGKIYWEMLTPSFLYNSLKKNGPMIVGLSATYLYWSKREFGENCIYDDINGEPQGHFVILRGINEDLGTVYLSDPHKNNPLGDGHDYSVETSRFINATLIGSITYDANFIAFRKKKK